MAIFVDLIIILIIGLCVFTGYRRGLAKCLLKLFTTVLALIIAIILYKPLVNFVVGSTTIDENIQLSLERILTNSIKENGTENKEIVKEDSGIPKPIVKYLNENASGAIHEKTEETVSYVARNATLLIVNLACVIAVYLIVKLLLQILTILIDIVAKLPVIKQFNELGGLIFGILEGFFIVLIILTLISILTPLTGNYYIADLVQTSKIGSFLYNNNIFLNLIF